MGLRDAWAGLRRDARPGLLVGAANVLTQGTRSLLLVLAGLVGTPSEVGVLAASFGLSICAATLLFTPLGTAVLRYRDGPSAGTLRAMAWNLAAGTALTLLALALDAATGRHAWALLPDPAWIWLTLLAALAYVAEQSLAGLCSRDGHLLPYSRLVLWTRGATLVGAAGLALLGFPVVALLAWHLATSLVLVGVAAAWSVHGLRGAVPAGLAADAFAAYPSAVAWFFIAQGPILVLGLLAGRAAAGTFALAYLLFTLPLVVPQGLAVLWSAGAAQHGAEWNWRRNRALLLPAVALHTALVALVAFAGPWTPLATPGFGAAFRLAAAMLPGAPGFALAALMLPHWMASGRFLAWSAINVSLGALYLGAVALVARDLPAVAACTAALGVALAVAHGWEALRLRRS